MFLRKKKGSPKPDPEGKEAVKQIYSEGAIGHCICSACGWRVDPQDRYCRRCGARFTDMRRTGLVVL